MSCDNGVIGKSVGVCELFNADKKETITSRLVQLAKNRTIRETAAMWGVSTATVNLYLKKGGMPSIDRALAIALAEGVSIAWLATGAAEALSNDECKINDSYQKWIKLFEQINQSDRDNLCNAIISRGINNILISDKALNIALMVQDLPEESRKEILLLINEAQRCALIGLPFKANNVLHGVKKASGGRT